MKTKPIHYTSTGPDSGHNDPNTDTYCGLGDSYSKGFENGTSKKEDVTCKKCLKAIQFQWTQLNKSARNGLLNK